MAESSSSSRPTGKDVALGVLAVVLPFAAVGLKRGFLTTHFWLCFLPTCFGYFPGVIHAGYIVWSKDPEPQPRQPDLALIHQHLPSTEPLPPAYLQHQHDLEAAHGPQGVLKYDASESNPFTEAEIHGDEVKVVNKGEIFGAGEGEQHSEV